MNRSEKVYSVLMLVLVAVGVMVLLYAAGIFDHISVQADFSVDPNPDTAYVVSPSQDEFEKLTKDDFVGINEHRNQAVKVITGIGQGSGFVIADNKMITCAHCFLKSSKTYYTSVIIEFSYQTNNGEICGRYLCQLDKMDIGKDVAISTILPNDWTEANTKPLVVESLDRFSGQEAVFYGYNNAGFVCQTEEVVGLATNKSMNTLGNYFITKDRIKLKPGVWLGCSGGPVIYNNKVIGMMSETSLKDSTCFCVQAKDIIEVLNES